MKNSLWFFLFSFLFLMSNQIFSQPGDVPTTQTTQLISIEKNGIAETNVGYFIRTPFLMVSGFLEKENSNINFSFRILKQNQWTEWKPFLKNHEGETPGRTTFIGGEIHPRAEKIQITHNSEYTILFTVRIFAPGHSDELNHLHNRSPEGTCTCEQPDVCGRTCWCPTGDCPIDSTPSPTTPTHIIVHHSAGQTTSNNFAAVVRSYWDLHVNTNGWDDIGYNWLVDGNGVIYEGRGSGVQGAHFSCMNENTTGICVIGNFESASPSTEAIDALQNFIAWELCDKVIDVLAADLHVSSGLNLDNISGHRDGNDSPNSCSATVCPGENLYEILPAIRDEIASFPCIDANVGNENILLENEKVEISPNPNQGFFKVKWENINVKNIVIFDASGKEIKNVNNLLGQQVQRFSINTEGLYFVKIELSDRRFFTEKIIIQ